MKNLVGIKFKDCGKTYYYNPKTGGIKLNTYVVVDTEQGEECIKVCELKNVDDEELKKYSPILRVANTNDLNRLKAIDTIQKEAFDVCNKKIEEYGLDMELTEVELKFDNSKILFYFTSDERIDFRELVKDLAAIYKTRIELRQIGIRDQVKKIGGCGICGRNLCCCSFLTDTNQVSIKMAKEQNISLNPYKISGNCGRLMCCLKYESEVYKEKLERLPEVGSIVKTVDGEGEVSNLEILRELITVKFKDDEGYITKKYKLEDIEVINKFNKEEE